MDVNEIRSTRRYFLKSGKLKQKNFKRYGLKQSPMSNGMKVFILSFASFVPGLGQLIGIVAAIAFMNCVGDKDRQSFGLALMVSSVVIFVLTCIVYFFMVICIYQAVRMHGLAG